MNLDLPVHHVMTSLPRTLRIDETLTDAWTWMLNGGFHHLPVTNEGQLVGMLSASDLRAVLRDLPDEIYDTGVILDDSRTVETLMTPDPVSIGPDAPLREAFEALATGRFHALPVTTGGLVVGIVTSTDLLRFVIGG
jgi:CBS domain-containing membrane protein